MWRKIKIKVDCGTNRYNRPTKHAQMKGEVKGGKEIANKKTNQTEKVWLVSWGGTLIIA